MKGRSGKVKWKQVLKEHNEWVKVDLLRKLLHTA